MGKTQFIIPNSIKDVFNKKPLKPGTFDNGWLVFNRYCLNDGKKQFSEYQFNKKIIQNAYINLYNILLEYHRKHYPVLNLTGEVKWRLIVGLGHEHVSETSISLHPTYGIPFIPGSAIKGAVRHWYLLNTNGKIKTECDHRISLLEKICEEFDPKKDKEIRFEDFERKFKTSFKKEPISQNFRLFQELKSENWHIIINYIQLFGNKHRRGCVVFLDAFPNENVKLKLDIINPHYSKYYRDNKPPADYQNPIPIDFLTVDEGTKFEIGLLIKSKNIELSELFELVKQTLQKQGIGAKTSVGYGFFKHIINISDHIKEKNDTLIQKEKEKQIKKQIQEKIAKMNPIERECYTLQKKIEIYYDDDWFQKSIIFYNRIDTFDHDEKIMAAQTLKTVWTEMKKWDGKQSKKQNQKISKIKQILERNG